MKHSKIFMEKKTKKKVFLIIPIFIFSLFIFNTSKVGATIAPRSYYLFSTPSQVNEYYNESTYSFTSMYEDYYSTQVQQMKDYYYSNYAEDYPYYFISMKKEKSSNDFTYSLLMTTKPIDASISFFTYNSRPTSTLLFKNLVSGDNTSWLFRKWFRKSYSTTLNSSNIENIITSIDMGTLTDSWYGLNSNFSSEGASSSLNNFASHLALKAYGSYNYNVGVIPIASNYAENLLLRSSGHEQSYLVGIYDSNGNLYDDYDIDTVPIYEKQLRPLTLESTPHTYTYQNSSWTYDVDYTVSFQTFDTENYAYRYKFENDTDWTAFTENNTTINSTHNGNLTVQIINGDGSLNYSYNFLEDRINEIEQYNFDNLIQQTNTLKDFNLYKFPTNTNLTVFYPIKDNNNKYLDNFNTKIVFAKKMCNCVNFDVCIYRFFDKKFISLKDKISNYSIDYNKTAPASSYFKELRFDIIGSALYVRYDPMCSQNIDPYLYIGSEFVGQYNSFNNFYETPLNTQVENGSIDVPEEITPIDNHSNFLSSISSMTLVFKDTFNKFYNNLPILLRQFLIFLFSGLLFFCFLKVVS